MFVTPFLVVLYFLSGVASLPTIPVSTGRRILIDSRRRSSMQESLDSGLFNPAFAVCRELAIFISTFTYHVYRP